jgi:hypothetical protein
MWLRTENPCLHVLQISEHLILRYEPNCTGQQSGKGIQGKPIDLRNLQHENVKKTQLSSTSFDTMLILLINNYILV